MRVGGASSMDGVDADVVPYMRQLLNSDPTPYTGVTLYSSRSYGKRWYEAMSRVRKYRGFRCVLCIILYLYLFCINTVCIMVRRLIRACPRWWRRCRPRAKHREDGSSPLHLRYTACTVCRCVPLPVSYISGVFEVEVSG